MLPWSWAEQRLTDSRNYWVTSLWPDGRQRSMPVSGRVGRAGAVVQQRPPVAQERDAIAPVAKLMNAKYGGITVAFLAANATILVRPRWAFGIAHDDFTGSSTRWAFD